ncbi:MAG: hypothetical protein IPI13_06240 [Actinomycetales bacterium]|jgi:hypothetical protein|uniref:DUF3325 domain-containing protein n=1 Tax=Candidatus Phosphoribacter hodrii TaxID=2953743 RepID=A0A934X3L2_9MICO|nr:hypothetical protein [Candidatus Phosphoribacter hodrii]MBP8838917.1 hypothetical protein [Dermatophilaceae bacterium]OPZ55504.1 MAG: hypothetical protein BWY91_00985 [bacterium ADurb.BinA028]MBK7272773.1 hypothetical protein [Candidatus Phosphoribacter hodrii]HPV78695.1 hypothetical protein [Dermatophilaceae bacterium]
MALPWWTLFVLAAAACSWISVTVLARNNPGERLSWFRSPTVAPLSQLWFLAASVACAWLGGSYAADTALGGWAYPIAALAVLVPWALVRAGHNRHVG